MRILILFSLIAIVLTGCSGTSSTNSTSPRVVYTGGGLKQVKELAGKRVREIELWDEPAMKDRLDKVLGGRLSVMTEDWLIESPIVAEGDVLMAAGCEQNNCDKNQWVMFADVANDNINIHHIKDGEMKSYKEKKDDIKLPQAFSDELNKLKTSQGVK